MGRYLVTGGAGFIGSHLVERLVDEGHEVRVADNFSTGRREHLQPVLERIELHEVDLAAGPFPRELLAGVEVVFHQAALPSVPVSVKQPLASHAACATGTISLLDACRHAGVRRLVYAGSSSAYGESPEMPKREDQLPETLSPYAAAKLTGELYCEAFSACYDLETVRLRYFNVYGPRQDPASPYSAVIPLFIQAIAGGRRPIIYGDGRQSRDFIHVEDVVRANLLAAEAAGASGRVFNVGTGVGTTLIDLATTICELTGQPFDPEFHPPREGDVRHSRADISRARETLGFEPVVDLPSGVRRTVSAFLR